MGIITSKIENDTVNFEYEGQTFIIPKLKAPDLVKLTEYGEKKDYGSILRFFANKYLPYIDKDYTPDMFNKLPGDVLDDLIPKIMEAIGYGSKKED